MFPGLYRLFEVHIMCLTFHWLFKELVHFYIPSVMLSYNLSIYNLTLSLSLVSANPFDLSRNSKEEY